MKNSFLKLLLPLVLAFWPLWASIANVLGESLVDKTILFVWRANEDDFTFDFQVNTTANSGRGKGSDYKIYVDISKNI